MSVWDSIHPCAFMVYMIKQGTLNADEAVMETLDCYGYKTPGGFPDTETMQREFDNYKKRKQSEDRTNGPSSGRRSDPPDEVRG